MVTWFTALKACCEYHSAPETGLAPDVRVGAASPEGPACFFPPSRRLSSFASCMCC